MGNAEYVGWVAFYNVEEQQREKAANKAKRNRGRR